MNVDVAPSQIETKSPDAKDQFVRSFQSIVGYFGRPNSPTVLFSGYPIDLSSPSLEDIGRATARCGLDVAEYSGNLANLSRSDLPVLIRDIDGHTFAVLEEKSPNSFLISKSDDSADGVISKRQLKMLKPASVLCFSEVYLNDEERALMGAGASYEKPSSGGPSIATPAESDLEATYSRTNEGPFW